MGHKGGGKKPGKKNGKKNYEQLMINKLFIPIHKKKQIKN